jgi:hypothetical protein
VVDSNNDLSIFIILKKGCFSCSTIMETIWIFCMFYFRGKLVTKCSHYIFFAPVPHPHFRLSLVPWKCSNTLLKIRFCIPPDWPLKLCHTPVWKQFPAIPQFQYPKVNVFSLFWSQWVCSCYFYHLNFKFMSLRGFFCKAHNGLDQ